MRFLNIVATSRRATAFVKTLSVSAPLALLLLASTPVHAGTVDSMSSLERLERAYWRGRTCETPACKRSRPGSVADVASFGLAAAAGVWCSRRRSNSES